MLVSLEYALNYLRIDIDPEDEAYQKEMILIQDCITAAEIYLVNATGKEYPETETPEEYAQERLFVCLLVADMYERRTPVVKADTNQIYQATITQLQMK